MRFRALGCIRTACNALIMVEGASGCASVREPTSHPKSGGSADAVNLFAILQHQKSSVELHHEPYLANSLPWASISTKQDFAFAVRPMRYTFPGCQQIPKPCAREISLTWA